MPLLLLTRPTASSKQTAALASHYGFDSRIEPLLKLNPTDNPRPEGDFQAVFITSSSAPEALREMGAPISDLLNLPCYCVGSSSGDAARILGFTNIHCGTSDGSTLARMALNKLTDNKRPLLHILGDHSDTKLADIITESQFTLTPWVVYHAQAATDFTPATRQSFIKGEIAAIPVFSPRSARILVSLIEKNQLTKSCSGIIAIGLSQAVANVLQTLPWRHLCVATDPTEEDVFKCLDHYMTQKEDNLLQPLSKERKGSHKFFYFLWLVVALIVAGCLGGFAVLNCPVFQALLPAAMPNPDLIAIEHRLDAIKSQVQKLSDVPQAPLGNSLPQNAIVADTIKDLQKQVEELHNDGVNNQQATQQKVAVSILFFNLRDAANNSHDFTSLLAAMQKNIGGDTELGDQLVKLEPYAKSPPPTWQNLHDMLTEQEAHNEDKIAPGSQATLQDKIKEILHPLISVHPLHNPQFASLHQALADHDAKEAERAFDTLPHETKDKLNVWKEQFDARVTIDDMLNTLAAHLGQLGGP